MTILLIACQHARMLANGTANAKHMSDLGITLESRPDHAAYLDNWLKVLKADKKAIFTAASAAAKATDYLAGLQAHTTEKAA